MRGSWTAASPRGALLLLYLNLFTRLVFCLFCNATAETARSFPFLGFSSLYKWFIFSVVSSGDLCQASRRRQSPLVGRKTKPKKSCVNRRLPQACTIQSTALYAPLLRSRFPPAEFNTTMQFKNYICIQDNKKPYFFEEPVVCGLCYPVGRWKRP